VARKIKKVEGGHGHHGGAWKVAYADFVTAMMALFMVLWLLASTDQQSRKEISQYFRTGILPEGDLSMRRAAQVTPAVIEEATRPPQSDGTADGKSAAAKQISDQLHKLAALDDDLERVIRNVKVSVTSEGVLVETVDEGDGLLFDLASARLNEPLQRFLRAFAPVVAQLDKKIDINGHTDARPFVNGSRLSNWDLSYQRAAAAREILEGSGVRPSQIAGVIARGASQLYRPARPYAPQNRRLSILVKIARPTAPEAVRASEITEER
jgi:chemotaxis protein MotB